MRTKSVTKVELQECELQNIMHSCRGSFGVAHRAIERATGRNWLVKFVACTTIERAMVRQEIDIRNDLRHPCLLQLHEAFETHGEFAFVLEL